MTVAAPLVLVMTAVDRGLVLALVIVTVVAIAAPVPGLCRCVWRRRDSHVVPVGSRRRRAKSRFSPLGVVYALGEEWTARIEGGARRSIRVQHVRVVGQDGLTLLVEPDTTVT